MTRRRNQNLRKAGWFQGEKGGLVGRIRRKHSAAVFVALLNGSVVLLLRRKATDWMNGAFSLPAGGLEEGETIAATAKREACKEIGVSFHLADLVYAHTLHILTEQRDWVGHFSTATRWEGTPWLKEPDKHCDLGWRRLQNLPRETMPYIRQALPAIDRRAPYSELGWATGSG